MQRYHKEGSREKISKEMNAKHELRLHELTLSFTICKECSWRSESTEKKGFQYSRALNSCTLAFWRPLSACDVQLEWRDKGSYLDVSWSTTLVSWSTCQAFWFSGTKIGHNTARSKFWFAWPSDNTVGWPRIWFGWSRLWSDRPTRQMRDSGFLFKTQNSLSVHQTDTRLMLGWQVSHFQEYLSKAGLVVFFLKQSSNPPCQKETSHWVHSLLVKYFWSVARSLSSQ